MWIIKICFPRLIRKQQKTDSSKKKNVGVKVSFKLIL